MTQGYDNDRPSGADAGPGRRRDGSDEPEDDVWTGETPDDQDLFRGGETAASQPGAAEAGRATGERGERRGSAPESDTERTAREVRPGSAPLDRARQRIERVTGGRPVTAITVLVTAALVLVALFIIIIVTGDESEPSPSVPCIMIELPGALDAIVNGEVAAIRATSPRGDVSSLAVAVEMDMADGTCRTMSQEPTAVEDRVAVLGAAMVYNHQTEQHQIEITLSVADLPPTATPTSEPTVTPLPTRTPTATPTQEPTEIPAVVGTPRATPRGTASPVLVVPATPAR
jgi:hypothetical protein